MLAGKPFFHHLCLKAVIALFVIISISSCVIINKYPVRKPFVYRTNINLKGDFSVEDKAALVSRLKAQLDDSVKARSVSKVFWSVTKAPPVYDSLNADKSVRYMSI